VDADSAALTRIRAVFSRGRRMTIPGLSVILAGRRGCAGVLGQMKEGGAEWVSGRRYSDKPHRLKFGP